MLRPWRLRPAATGVLVVSFKAPAPPAIPLSPERAPSSAQGGSLRRVGSLYSRNDVVQPTGVAWSNLRVFRGSSSACVR